MTSIFFVQYVIQQLLDSVFVISTIIKVLITVISLSFRLRLITLSSTLIFLDITKTSSNNCLELAFVLNALGLGCIHEDHYRAVTLLKKIQTPPRSAIQQAMHLAEYFGALKIER